jgi:hypothetical protein
MLNVYVMQSNGSIQTSGEPSKSTSGVDNTARMVSVVDSLKGPLTPLQSDGRCLW